MNLDRNTFRAAAIVALAAIAGHHMLAHVTGFYYDDWVFLEIYRKAGGFWAAARAFFDAGHMVRPIQILQLPIFYGLSHQTPPMGQAILALMGAAEGILFYRLILEITGRARLALLCSVIMVLYPNRGVTHIWVSNGSQLLSHCLVLAGFIAFLRGARASKSGLKATGLLLYFLGLMTYESTYFIPLLLVGAALGDGLAGGKTPKEAFVLAVRSVAPFAVPLALAVLWQRWGIVWLFDGAPKPANFSLSHFFRAFGAGFECVTNRVLHISWRQSALLFEHAKTPFIAGSAALAAFLAWTLKPRAKDVREGLDKKILLPLLCASAAAYVGTYLPYALSGSYMPQIFGAGARVNGTGAWSGALLWTAVLYATAASGKRGLMASRALLSLLLLGFCWANAYNAIDWASMWSRQLYILRKVHARMAGAPTPWRLLLNNYPKSFNSHYDFDRALRLTNARTDRSDIGGNVVTPRLEFRDDGVYDVMDGVVLRRYDYDGLFYYDLKNDRLSRVNGPRDDPRKP